MTAAKKTWALLLSTAVSCIGYVEGRVNRTKFGKWIGMDGQPWCASWVSWILAQAGFTGYKSASAQALYDQFRAQGRAGTKPKPYAIVFYHMAGGHPSVNHTGFVRAKYALYMKTIEGNTSSGMSGSQVNGGGVYERTRSYLSVVGYGYPPYVAETAPAPVGYWVSARTKRTGNLGLVSALAWSLGDTNITAARSDGSRAFLAYAGLKAALRIQAFALSKGIICKVQKTTLAHDDATMLKVLATE